MNKAIFPFAQAIQRIGKAYLVLGFLVATLLFSEKQTGPIGDALQIALPVAALGCSIANGGGGEFALRFTGMLTTAHATKYALDGLELDQRPSGGKHGFPSAHTSAAVFGASALVHDCVASNPAIRAIVILSAAFVGGSRIAVQAHDIWQVLAGAILGLCADRVLRRRSMFRTLTAVTLRKIRLATMRASRWAILNLVRRTGRDVGWRHAGMRLWLAAVVFLLNVSDTKAETELTFYLGGQNAAAGQIDHSLNGVSDVIWLGKSFDPPPYYGLRATLWREDGWGWGAEINHAKVYAEDPAALGYDRLELTDGMNLVTLNLFHRWHESSRRWTPYLGVGAGLAIPHVDVQPTGQVHTFGYQVTGPAVQAVAGIGRALNDRWSLVVEYKATWSSHKAELESGGTLSADIKTQAVNLGLAVNF